MRLCYAASQEAGLSGFPAIEFPWVRLLESKIVITPQLVIDRSKFPTADDEYTPEERRAIDVSLAESEKGPYHGPFKSGSDIAAFMKKRRRGARPSKSNKSR